MAITREIVLKTAKLARFQIAESKIDLYIKELSSILNLIDVLNEVNTDNVEPLVNVNEFPLVMQKDEVLDGNCVDKIMQNAPKQKFDYFLVPKVIE